MTNKILKQLGFVFLCVLTLTLNAQESRKVKSNVSVTYAKKIGTTKALKHLVPRDMTNRQKKSADKSMIRPPRNFIGRHQSRVKDESKVNSGPDKLRQKYISTNKSMVLDIEPLINIEGLNIGSSPHDPSGDVGENYYMQAINVTVIGLYNKNDGSLVTSFNGNTLWSELGYSSAGDPIILYDQEFNRWIITEFAQQGNNLLVAISADSDPMGQYDVYNFTTPRFPDYPKYAIWKDSYTLTTNEEGAGVLHSYFMNRDDLLNGAEEVRIQRVDMPGNANTEAGFYVATPVDWTGENLPPSDRDPMFLALNDSSWNTGQEEDQIEVFSVNVDWDDERNTTLTQQSIEVSAFDSYPCAAGGFGFACIPQLDGFGIDGIPEIIMNQVQYRNFGTHESMVLNFITDADDGNNLSGIRWMELRRSDSEEWSVYQEGTLALDDGLHRYMGGIAMDGAGNIGLAYNVSSENEYVGVRFTGRRVSDPLGTMTVNEYNVVDGQSAINSGTRFGDYAHMAVDPFNDKTFWYTTEYAGANDVRTRIISFELKQDTFDIAPVNLKTPISGSLLSNAEEVEITVRNFGLDTVRNFSVGYGFENLPAVIEDISFELLPDSSFTHVFMTPVDVSVVGDYDIKLFTSLDVDQNILNDTINAIITNIPQIDLSITGIDGLGPICSDAATVDIQLLNLGTLDISNATFDLALNGVPVLASDFTGQISPNNTASLTVQLSNLLDGDNTLDISVNTVNGMPEDEVVINNTFSTSIMASTNGFMGNIQILTDNFPEETTWILTLDSGELIAQGGPYPGETATTVDIPLCLDPDLCYTFTIFDSYGDGISFGADGGYVITNDNGAILSTIMDANFGTEEENSFCGLFVCNVSARADNAPTSTPGTRDGMIMVDVLTGAGPFEYSLDNGATYQSSNIFSDLASGEYQVTVRGTGDCIYVFNTAVFSCDIDVAVTIVPESDIDANDGELELDITGNFGSTLISINGGGTLGTTTQYTGLTADDYEVFVRDSLGCEFTEIVHLGNTVSSEEIVIGSIAKVYPNPTDGVFRIELIGAKSSGVYIPMTLYNVKGEVIQRNNLAKYDDGYLGTMSLYHYPSGLYYLKIEDASVNKLLRIIRE